MNIKLDRKLENDFKKGDGFLDVISGINKEKVKKGAIDSLKKKKVERVFMSQWNYVVPFLLLTIFIGLVLPTVFNLQVVQGSQLHKRSVENRLEILNIQANRGVIFDRNGKKVAENIPSINVSIDFREYKVGTQIDVDRLVEDIGKIEKVLPSKYKDSSISDRVIETLDEMNATERALAKSVVLARGVDNQTAILLKALSSEVKGIIVDDGSQRLYTGGVSLSHILGYTGEVYAEDLENLDYIKFDDVIGRSGVEKAYDIDLIGRDGRKAREVDVLGNIVSDSEVILQDPVSGSNLHLSIDSMAQEKMYKVLESGVKKYGGTGAVGILQDVNTGELLVLASYPSFDNNKFIGGISVKEYTNLLNDKRTPLNNRAIAAQIPPGSTFKTIIAAAALDAGVINRNTVYVSRAGYSFSNGARFQEYRDKVYGPLTVIDALSVSSNIFFCETVRNWDMNKLVKYLENFGIGKYTLIDIPGEGAGLSPSPENKIRLANSTSPWLDPIWYPEGDSCNSVIGQGITTVTPIQMSNWVAAIANGGRLNKPHVGVKMVDSQGNERVLEHAPLNEKVVSSSALSIVREGMWASVNGPRRVIFPLSDMKVEFAAKTGTAEFGRLNSKGIYEHTHAWVTGFFPYDRPKYSFVVLLEDGGESFNASSVAKEFLDWWLEYSK